MAKRNRQLKGSSQRDLRREPFTSVSLPQSQSNEGTPNRIQIIESIEEEAFSGPLPPPRILAEYDTISPGFADRILGMAEQEQNHRHTMETKSLNGLISSRLFGQIAAFLLGVLGIGGGLYLVSNGKSVEGLSAFFVALGSLMGVFVLSKKQPKAGSSSGSASPDGDV